MIVTNQTSNDYWFGPMHLAAGVGQTLTVDDTSDTSLYLSNDAIADALNNLYLAGNITVSSAAGPFPRPTGTPQLLHGDGSPEGIVYAPPGSLYMRRDNSGAPTALYAKTTAIQFETGWQAMSSAAPDSAGWITLSATLTYSSSDGHTYVCTTSSDLSPTIPLGARIQLTHSATIKYFLVTAISSGSITLYGGSDYSLSSGAISDTSYAIAKAPFGFPLNPLKWTEELSDTSDQSQSSPTTNTWYNIGSLSLAIPIGAWHVSYQVNVYGATSSTSCNVDVALSTTNSSASDPELLAEVGISAASGNSTFAPAGRDKHVLLASKTSYYLNARARNSVTAIQYIAATSGGNTIIRAVSAYL